MHTPEASGMQNLRNGALAFVAALLVTAVGASASSTAAAGTRTIVFQAKRMRVTKTIRGHCWTTSIASRRRTAYRCMSGNGIHDPCFSLSAKAVACPTLPAAGTGLRIALTKPLPARPHTAPWRNVWAMELAGGQRCNAATGTVMWNYRFYCSGNLVCQSPPARSPARAIFVQCAREGKKMQLSNVGRYLVRLMYE